MKKLFCILTCICVLVAVCVMPASAETTVSETKITVGDTTAYIDGEAITLDIAPVLKNNEVFVSVYYVSQFVDATPSWDNTTQTASFQKESTTIALTIDSTTAQVNGENVTIPVAPFMESSRAVVPVRFVAATFGNTVSWDADTQTMTINPSNAGSSDNNTDSSTAPEIKLTVGSTTAYIDGIASALQIPVTLKNDTVMVQARFLGATFSNATPQVWDAENYTLSFGNGNITVEFTANENTAKVNGEIVTLPEPLYTIEESAPFFLDAYYLPVAFVAETFGATVIWDADSQTMTINPKTTEPPAGDIDGNGIVNIKDALTMLDAVLNGTSVENADMNGDEIVNLLDVLHILKAITA